MHENDLRERYITLLRDSLSGLTIRDAPFLDMSGPRFVRQPGQFNQQAREAGKDWPSQALTMIGLKRMDNIRSCVESVLREGIPGDLIETGVWRGGAAIYMRGLLAAHGVADRTVWAADSFEGLPPPNSQKYPSDGRPIAKILSNAKFLSVSYEEVEENFRRYHLLDEQVRFLKGWFSDTLPGAPIDSLAVLRLDGDLYESTMDALVHLYPKVTPGGYIIIDDYVLNPCREAVTDFRNRFAITEEPISIDSDSIYWRKGSGQTS